VTLWLHLGPPKTASSLGQAIFGSAMSGTGRPGSAVVYPVAGTDGKRPAHHVLARYLRDPAAMADGFAASGAAEICRLLGRTSVLLSSELFPPLPGAFRRLTDAARAAGHDVTMIFVVRDPVTRLNSMYGQVVRNLVRDYSFEAFLAEPYEKRIYPKSVILRAWLTAGCRVEFLRYAARDMGRVYRDLCARIGLEPGTPAREIVNPSLSAAAVRTCLDFGQRVNVRGYLRFMIDTDREMGLRPFFGFDAGAIARTLDLLRDEYSGLPLAGEPADGTAPPVLDAAYPEQNVEIAPAVLAEYRDRLFARLAAQHPGWLRPDRA
jgi:hypothetical protein